MLVVISDLHLSDGSRTATLPPGALEIFAERVRELAVAASWRADGNYRPIEKIDIVLLGDTLDALRSAQWLASPAVRPWSDPQSAEFCEVLSRITGGILENNEDSLAVLRGLIATPGVTIPPALRAGRPAPDVAGEPVSVRLHALVGNCDWFYHVPGARQDMLRQEIVRRMGLSNRPDRPFPHDSVECEELLQTMRRHRVAARHGDLFDPLNFEGDRAASSLGDAMVIELLGRFAAEVEAELGEDNPPSLPAGLREIDCIRPIVLAPVWIDGLLERTCPIPAIRNRVRRIWDRLLEDFLAIDFVRDSGARGAGLVAGLSDLLRFGRRSPAGWADSIAAWYYRLRGADEESYLAHALAEPDYRNRRAKHIVYGHTHTAQTAPLDASYAESYVLNQVYFNAGTWRRTYRMVRQAPRQNEFIASDEMTWLTFYQGDERTGRPYETWSGTLGAAPTENTVHRIDPGRTSHVSGQPLSTPVLHQHAPHFAALPIKSGLLSGRRV